MLETHFDEAKPDFTVKMKRREAFSPIFFSHFNESRCVRKKDLSGVSKDCIMEKWADIITNLAPPPEVGGLASHGGTGRSSG